MGHIIQKRGDTISRLLRPAEANIEEMQRISRKIFQHRKRLYCVIDDTLIKKYYSRFMQGSGMFFNTKLVDALCHFD